MMKEYTKAIVPLTKGIPKPPQGISVMALDLGMKSRVEVF